MGSGVSANQLGVTKQEKDKFHSEMYTA